MSASLFHLLRRPSRLRLTATLLCLLACTLQSFVAQTHVHVRGESAPGAVSYDNFDGLAAASPASTPDPDSAKHDGRNGSSNTCPLCQVVLHGGAAPAPAFALSLPLPIALSVARYEQEPRGPLVAVSFNWQGRAPPLA